MCIRDRAYYGVVNEKTVILDMSVASGLPLIPKEKRDPELTTSYGTGELIRAALDSGYRDIIIALGGSATNDGGMGAMAALGVRFLDDRNQPVKGIGANLIKVKPVSYTHLDDNGDDTLCRSVLQTLILSRLVNTFISRISLTMLPVPNSHNTVCVLSGEEARHWQSRSSGYSSS